MKKFVWLILVAVLALALVACGEEPTVDRPNQTPGGDKGSTETTAPAGAVRPAGNFRRNGTSTNPQRPNYSKTTTITQFPGKDLSMGQQDTVRQEVVR